MKNRRVAILTVLALAAVLLQIFPPVRRDNPPVTGEIDAPPEVLRVLRRACYDCHSNLTRWPWYSRLAPVSWLISRDVHDARKKLNFSTWQDIPAAYRGHYREEIVEHVEEGDMPLPRYRLLHPGARVTPEELGLLKGWMSGPGSGGGLPADGFSQ